MPETNITLYVIYIGININNLIKKTNLKKKMHLNNVFDFSKLKKKKQIWPNHGQEIFCYKLIVIVSPKFIC